VQTPYLECTKWYDPKKRKPELQIKILDALAIKGKLSKSKAKYLLTKEPTSKKGNTIYNYKEISDAFDILKNKGLIEFSHTMEGPGKPEKYYRMTEKGLTSIIVEEPTPAKFWSFVIGFCHHRDGQVGLNKIDEFYQCFISKYLKFPSAHGFLFQLDYFNKMCSKWLQKNDHNNNEEVSLAQKVIEILALYSEIDLKELIKKSASSEKEVLKILTRFTSLDYHYDNIHYKTNEDYFGSFSEQYLDFLQHCIVIVKCNDKDNTIYELSLFGIIMVMSFIHLHDNRRAHLFYNIPLQDYYEKIASNYRDKLPLIFGKWSLLKTKLGAWSAYNFDIIVDEESRSIAMDAPVIMQGNKEFYQNMQAIALCNNEQLAKVFSIGLKLFKKYQDNKSSYLLEEEKKSKKNDDNNQKAFTVYQKVEEIGILNKWLNPKVFQAGLVTEEQKNFIKIKPEFLEKSFAQEITFLYYLNLHNDIYIPLLFPNIYTSKFVESMSTLLEKLNQGTVSDLVSLPDLKLLPKVRLLSIIKRDEEIRKWFSSWLKDLVNYQKLASETMSQFYDDILKEK
jgi:hypothetical protein